MVVLPYHSILTSSLLYLCMAFKTPVLVPKLPFFEEVLGKKYPFLYDDFDDMFSKLRNIDQNDLETLGDQLYQQTKSYHPKYICKSLSDMINTL
jgi:hypothetical protein